MEGAAHTTRYLARREPNVTLGVGQVAPSGQHRTSRWPPDAVSRMKTTTSARLVAGALLIAATALSETPWRKTSVKLGWVRQPNPDETGKSSEQRTKLLGDDTLTYSRMDQVEKYLLAIQDEHGSLTVVTVSVPTGTVVFFSGGRCDDRGSCERYDVDRVNGKKATVAYGTNAPPPPPPPSGFVTQ